VLSFANEGGREGEGGGGRGEGGGGREEKGGESVCVHPCVSIRVCTHLFFPYSCMNARIGKHIRAHTITLKRANSANRCVFANTL